MKSKIIEDYYKFLREEDENHKGNAEIIDDGSEALYCLLFKLMGDQRSMSDLIDIFDMPTASEFQYSAESGKYESIITMARDHGCAIEENGATLIISEEIIQKLEGFVPPLIERIKAQEWAKEESFLNSLLSS
jgi:hypothetical protein